ncbi:MAG: ABC transporter ATP-binding protein [Planctomycetales bacterium]|nr:ABC transporter ATP-binding protein [Planctomycetales bacterium]
MLLLQGVKKTFVDAAAARLPILDIEHFATAAGEQMVVRGRSGSGKTTLLHVIAGISRADAGKVEIDGVDITRLPEAGRDRFRADKIGYIFQTFNLLPAFSALENVLLGMSFSGGRADRARAIGLLEQVGLKHRMDHSPQKLSVGEQQRVAVARALANRPKLLLADEPTANVDPANQQQIVDLIRQRCEDEKIALVLVTHETEVAEQFDRVETIESFNQVLSNS